MTSEHLITPSRPLPPLFPKMANRRATPPGEKRQ